MGIAAYQTKMRVMNGVQIWPPGPLWITLMPAYLFGKPAYLTGEPAYLTGMPAYLFWPYTRHFNKLSLPRDKEET
jgi:hypothetical protein